MSNANDDPYMQRIKYWIEHCNQRLEELKGKYSDLDNEDRLIFLSRKCAFEEALIWYEHEQSRIIDEATRRSFRNKERGN